MKSKFWFALILFSLISCTAWSAHYTRPRVVLETNYGDITIELFPDRTPITVANFLGYVNSGYYDGSTFHRVVRDFVIQGGQGDPCQIGDPIQNEPYLSNVRGTVAMAKKGGLPDSATCEFFINLDDNSFLDQDNGGFTVFGKVVGDMNVVDTIAGVDTIGGVGILREKPVNDVNIFSAYELNCSGYILGDLDENCKVDFFDFAIMADNWLAGDISEVSHRGVTTQIVGANKDFAGDIFVWQDSRNGNDDIYAYDILTDTEFPIFTDTNDQQDPAISGDIVVCVDEQGNGDIHGYDISLDKEFVITAHPNLPETQPAISGNIVVWRDYRDYHTEVNEVKLITDIYGADITDPNDPNVFAICTAIRGQLSPAIDGNIVVWEDYRNEQHDIYGADISNHNEPNVFAICTVNGDQIDPAISGNIVIWQDDRYAGTSIFGYDLSTGTEFEIIDGDIGEFDISGNIVTWQDRRNGRWDIYAADVSDPNNIKEFAVSIADANEYSLVISGETVLWRDSHDITDDLHWRQFDGFLPGDINGDCKVDPNDSVELIGNWLENKL